VTQYHERSLPDPLVRTQSGEPVDMDDLRVPFIRIMRKRGPSKPNQDDAQGLSLSTDEESREET